MAEIVISSELFPEITQQGSDAEIAEIVTMIAKGFHEGGGVWLSITSKSEAFPPHHRWVPRTATVAVFYDDDHEPAAPSLTLVL